MRRRRVSGPEADSSLRPRRPSRGTPAPRGPPRTSPRRRARRPLRRRAPSAGRRLGTPAGPWRTRSLPSGSSAATNVSKSALGLREDVHLQSAVGGPLRVHRLPADARARFPVTTRSVVSTVGRRRDRSCSRKRIGNRTGRSAWEEIAFWRLHVAIVLRG